MSDEEGENNALKTMNLPINEHFFKLECMIEELIGEVQENDKAIQILKGDFLAIGYENNLQNQEISLFVQDEVSRLGREKIKQVEQDYQGVLDIRKLISAVNDVKKNISQQVSLINHRVTEVESNVGFKYFYNPNLPSDDTYSGGDQKQGDDPRQANFNIENQNNSYNQESEEEQYGEEQNY